MNGRFHKQHDRISWMNQELRDLKMLYPSAIWATLKQKFPKRTRSSLRTKASHMGIRRPRYLHFAGLPKLARMGLADRAYLAGLVDGEGCITLRCDRVTYTPVLFVANTNVSVIKWAKRTTNIGYVRQHPRKGNRKQLWIWAVYRTGDVLALLRQLKPFLKVKERHVALLLKRRPPFSKTHAERIHSLNHRGRSPSPSVSS